MRGLGSVPGAGEEGSQQQQLKEVQRVPTPVLPAPPHHPTHGAGLLEGLGGESPGSSTPPSPTAASEGGGADEEYSPPGEAALLEGGFIQPVSLAQGEESEDELETLAALGGGGAAADPLGGADPLHNRFALLRALWASAT